MTTVLWLLCLQGALGGFDTVYYHEWRARLPAGGERTRPELSLHAARSLIYAVVFGTLPWIAWRGPWAVLLALLLAAEIVVTLCDFVVEDRVRAPLGGVFPGERVTHAVMGIVYGAMLAHLVPELLRWAAEPAGLRWEPVAPSWLRHVLAVMAVGVAASGLRDLLASLAVPGSAWPWQPAAGGGGDGPG